MTRKLWDGGPVDQGSVQSLAGAGPELFVPEVDEEPVEVGAEVEGVVAGDGLEALEVVLEEVAELEEPRESVT
jgi:hypothetical protein